MMFLLPEDLPCGFGHLLAEPDFDCCVWCEAGPRNPGAWAA